MKKTKKRQLELIEAWFTQFPCEKILGKYVCIFEFLDAKEILELIEKRYKQYKKNKNE